MATTTVNGVRLAYTLTGDSGPPLVLVHGSWADQSDWEMLVPPRRALPRPHLRPPRPQPERMSARTRERRRGRCRFGGLDRTPESRARTHRWPLARGLHRPPARDAPSRPDPELECPGAPASRPARRRSRARTRNAGGLGPGRCGGRPPGRRGRGGGARQFIEAILGPGAWNYLPPEQQQILISNAPTFLDEMRDPEVFTIDLAALATCPHPALLTHGDQSPTWFVPIVAKLATVLPRAETRVFAGAGHLPMVTHPAEYAAAVMAHADAADAELGTNVPPPDHLERPVGAASAAPA